MAHSPNKDKTKIEVEWPDGSRDTFKTERWRFIVDGLKARPTTHIIITHPGTEPYAVVDEHYQMVS